MLLYFSPLFPNRSCLCFEHLFVSWFLSSWVLLSLYITWSRRQQSQDNSVVILMISEEQKLLAFKQYFQCLWGTVCLESEALYFPLLKRIASVFFTFWSLCETFHWNVNYKALIIWLKWSLPVISQLDLSVAETKVVNTFLLFHPFCLQLVLCKIGSKSIFKVLLEK